MTLDNVADIYPLSPLQLGLLFHALQADDDGVYVVQYTCQLRGPLDPSHFRAAFEKTVERHPILRTAVLWEGLDDPLQIVREFVSLPWDATDWRGFTDDEQQGFLSDYLAEDRQRGFDLSSAPLMRVGLITLDDNAVQLVLSVHHLMCDGWSLPIIWHDVLRHYHALQNDQSPELEPARPYRDYIAWLLDQDLSATEPFWRAELAGFAKATPLPMARPGPADGEADYSGIQCHHVVSEHLTTELTALARQSQVTLNTLVQGAWALLLSAHSGDDRVVHGSVLSGRQAKIPGVERIVGPLINTLPVITPIPPHETLAPWLQALQQQFLVLNDYHVTPLNRIQRCSALAPGEPLFESIVVFENYPQAPDLAVGFEQSNTQFLEQSHYPLGLLVVPNKALELFLLATPQHYDHAVLANLLRQFERLLAAFIESPRQTLTALRHQFTEQL
ncbi:MAG: condensation domain-containing protein [Pseudomonadota bacterium]